MDAGLRYSKRYWPILYQPMAERNLLIDPLPEVVNPAVRERIPEGGYCHKVSKIMTPGGQVIRLYYCPFYYGVRPNGGCMLYGSNPFLEDAIKVCGIKKPSFRLKSLH